MARRKPQRIRKNGIYNNITAVEDPVFEQFNEIFESMVERQVLTTNAGEYLSTQNNDKIRLD